MKGPGEEGVSTCPCEGKWSAAWHTKWKVPFCEHASRDKKLKRRFQPSYLNRNRVAEVARRKEQRVRAGDSVYIPEHEEL